jgi:Cu-Zn family superoxide dismutase
MGTGRVRLERAAAKSGSWAAVVLVGALALPACTLPYIPGVTSPPPSAGATLKDGNGAVVGSAVFLQQDDGIRILLDVKGLAPGTKGVHIHAVGRCEGPGFESAGGHFNPTNAQHGLENPKGPHAGDLPNIVVDATGRGHLEFTDSRVNLKPQGPGSLLDGSGTALIVHQDEDDQRTDPAGNSGPRVACGVVTPAG